MKVETPFPMAFQMQPTRQGEEQELQVRHAGRVWVVRSQPSEDGRPLSDSVTGQWSDTVPKDDEGKRGGGEHGTRKKYQHDMTWTGLLLQRMWLMLVGGGEEKS